MWIPTYVLSPFVSSCFLSQTCSHCLDTPEENPYFPTYKFPELPEILQNSEGTISLDSASVVIALRAMLVLRVPL